jgi:hypothetical protein
VADLPEDWEEALPCPDPPTPPPPPTPPSPPAPPSPPPAPPTPPPLYVCLLHAGTFSRKLQVFATVRLETDKTNHCLVGGASGGLGSGQALADAYFPTVPENAMSEKDRHAHSCCLFDGRYMAMSGAEQVSMKPKCLSSVAPPVARAKRRPGHTGSQAGQHEKKNSCPAARTARNFL